MKKKGKRHPLLIFRQIYYPRRFSFLFVSLLFVGLYAFLYLGPKEITAPIPWPPSLDWLLLAVAVIAFIIFLFKLAAGRLPYVRCAERNIRIQTPFYPMFISYRRIKETRPNPFYEIFPKGKLKRNEQRVLDKVMGQTAIVVDMDGFPMSRALMRLWIPNLMFNPNGTGLVLWVEDWMTLNRELSDFKDRWRDQKMGRADSGQSLYSRLQQR